MSRDAAAIRDLVAGLAITHLASVIADPEIAHEIRGQAMQLAEAGGERALLAQRASC